MSKHYRRRRVNNEDRSIIGSMLLFYLLAFLLICFNSGEANVVYDIQSNNTLESKLRSIVSDESSSIRDQLGDDIISLEEHDSFLVKYKLPRDYHKNIDDWSFQPFMSYSAITNKSSGAYKIVRNKRAYTDENGFRRFKVDEDGFTVNGDDDYIIALGNYYKKKGSVGDRYLIVTTTGRYTAIVGDEKSNSHTDKRNMFTIHGKNKAGVIEWILDTNCGRIARAILKYGTVTKGDNLAMQGKIRYIYKIL